VTEPDKRLADPRRAPAADGDRGPGRANGGLALIIALGALSGFGPLCLDMYLPALPQLPADLSSTSAAAQLTLSSCIVGLAVGQLITGPLSDRLGRRGPLLVGVAIFVVASVICALTTSMTVLIAVRLVQGAAGAAGIVVGRAVVADMFAGKVAAAYFSAIATINGLAPILAPVIGGQVLRVGTWRTVFWVLAGIGVLMLVLAALVIKDSACRPSNSVPASRSMRPGSCWPPRSAGCCFAGPRRSRCSPGAWVRHSRARSR
jgi:DHA1 family bicyclomycin/chloramphenicol resistance-like MFS transporter